MAEAADRERSNIANKVLLNQMKFYHKHCIQQGDIAISRCIESTAVRIEQKRSVPLDMQNVFRTESARALVKQIADEKQGGWHSGLGSLEQSSRRDA
jgi:hypothetical protein